MFVGHIGVGLALKKVAPEINLGALLFASLLLDILLGVFVLAGVETIIVPAEYARLHYLTFRFPYSHSLVAVIGWSVAALGVSYGLWNRNGSKARLRVSVTVAAAVLLHWACDWLVHPPQLPVMAGNSSLLGLGLWNHLELALLVEVLLVAIGLTLYLRSTSRISRMKRWGMVAFISLLTVMAVAGQTMVTQAPQPVAVAASLLLQVLVVCGVAVWLDRKAA